MQLLVQNCLDLSHATEIFSVPKRRIFALPKIVRHRNKVDYSMMLNFRDNVICCVWRVSSFVPQNDHTTDCFPVISAPVTILQKRSMAQAHSLLPTHKSQHQPDATHRGHCLISESDCHRLLQIVDKLVR